MDVLEEDVVSESDEPSYTELTDAPLQLNDTLHSVPEVTLLPEGVRPSTTAELVGMLKQAGTELTVKYITGEMSFEDFCQELENMKPKPVKSQTSLESASVSSASIPAFDLLIEEDNEEEDDDEEEENMEEDEEGEEGDEEDIEDNDFVDAGEVSDKRDEDWVPGEDGTKQKKEKTKGKDGKKKAQPTREKRKRPFKRRRRQYDLPKQLAGSNGRAMLLRAQGKTDEAVMLLYDIISKAPKAAAPYEALGNIHEEQRDLHQALKFYMVAANLRGTNATEWMDLVEMCIRLKEEKLASTCFTKALKVAKTSEDKVDIMTKKSAYFEELQMPVRALQCREQMLGYLNKANPRSILSVARNLVSDYLELKEENGAVSVLQFIHKELPNDIDSGDVHQLSELLMSQKSYLKSLEVIIKHCGVEVTFSDRCPSADELLPALEDFASKETCIESLKFPDLMPVDLRSKLVQCLVKTKSLPTLSVIKDLIKSLTDADVEQYGDIHYDISETMVECGYHLEARPILQALVHSERYNKAAVWLTYGQCLNALGEIKEASEAYTQVVELAPGHYGARVTLSSLLQQMGHNDIALEVLSKGPTEQGEATADQLLLLHKCQLLHSQGKTEEFISAARKLLSFNTPGQCNPEFIKVLLGMRTPKSRKNIMPQLTAKKTNQDEEPSREASESRERKQGEEKKFRSNLWDVYVKLCTALHDQGQMDDLLETATVGLTAFSLDETFSKDAEFLCMKIGPVNMNIYHLARNLIVEEKDNNQAWNLYCYIVTRLREVSDLRFAMRALMKNPNSLALGMLNGNARMISGTYKQALGEYLAVFRQTPDDDLALLCSALCLVHIASQAFVTKKNMLIAQVICLLNAYKELRGECQETYYNMGRAMYQLNIQYAAVHYYKMALKFPPMVCDEQGTFDLTHEIAFNLSQIFLKSNNPELARYYIEKYCVI